jgi:hypothetical protein
MKDEIIVESKYVVLSHDAFVNFQPWIVVTGKGTSWFSGLSMCFGDANVAASL